MWGPDAWPLCPRRDPPMVFVLIFLNKRCYPREGGPLCPRLGLDWVEPEHGPGWCGAGQVRSASEARPLQVSKALAPCSGHGGPALTDPVRCQPPRERQGQSPPVIFITTLRGRSRPFPRGADRVRVNVTFPESDSPLAGGDRTQWV